MASEVYREPVDPAATNNPHSYALQMTGSGKRVLEIGCSVGHVTEHLVAGGNTVVGVEIDSSAAEAAREFAERVHVIDLDITPLSSVEQEKFDAIILGDVLEHLRDPDATLRDVLELLAEGGRVIISVPNVAHVDVRLMLLEGRWEYQSTGLLDATHLRWFTKASLRQLLADAGLVAIRLERVRIGRFGSDIELDADRSRTDVLAFIAADPEADTFQFVVEAVPAESSTGQQDALAEDTSIEWPTLDHAADVVALQQWGRELEAHNAAVEAHNVALQANLDAWERSTLVRITRPVRAAWSRVRRTRSS